METLNYKVNYGFTPETFPLGTHMCYIFNDDDERRKVVSKFVESGLLANEKVVYLADVATVDVLSVHPLMIVQGQVVRNPYYILPDEFLATNV